MKTVEMIGKKFNKLFIDCLSENSNTYVDVTCECGNRYSANASDIRRGKVKQCKKCSNNKLEKEINPGDKFGKLTVLKELFSKQYSNKNIRMFECLCECGTTTEVAICNLTNGHTKSCGCLNLESAHHKSDYLIGNCFGELKVDSFAFAKDGNSYYNCVCSCGTKCIIAGCHIKKGKTISCGCVKSKLEKETAEFLTRYNKTFSKEYTFPDLRSSNGGRLKFDFAIYDLDNTLSALIECQGIQHVDSHNDFGKLQREETDELKKIYCKENNIQLYEIWYNDNVEEKIKEILIELNLLT